MTAAATVVELCDAVTNYFKEVEDINQKHKSNIQAIQSKPKVNERESKYAEDKELYYQQLIDINEALQSGNIENIDDVKYEVKKINKWYNSISYEYPEIEKLLREIKRKI